MTLAMSASEVDRNPFKMTRYAATNVKYNPESQKTMRTKKYFKLTPTQEDIYKLLNTTEERPMSSTLSPYAPLPAIGNTFIGSTSKSDKKSNRKQDHKHQVVMETVELKRTKSKKATRLETTNNRPDNIAKAKSLDLGSNLDIAKSKSLDFGSNHGRHILNINVLEEKKRSKSRDVLLSKTNKSEDVEFKDSVEILEKREPSNNEGPKVSESKIKPSWLSRDDEQSKGSIIDHGSDDNGLNITSDLSALSFSSDNLETKSIHESEEFIHNCIKDIEKKGASSRPSTQLTPKRVKNEKHFTLVRERTYDLLEPKILKGKQEEMDLVTTDRSLSRGGNGNTRQWSHKVALEQFGEISLEQSTGSIAFGRRLSSSEVEDIDDCERSTTSGNTSDFVNDINDNTGEELNNQIWQLRNSNRRETDSSNPRRRTTNNVGTIPRVLELKRSHIEGLPSASRFSKEDDGDPEAWGMRNKMMNRLNCPLRLKSGQVNDNSVRTLDITPLRLDDTSSTSVAGTRMLSGRGKLSAARFRDVRTPYIEEIGSIDSGIKLRNSRDGNRNVRIWDTKTPSLEETDSDLSNMRFESASSKSTNNSRFSATKTQSNEEADSFDASRVCTESGGRRSRGRERQLTSSSNRKHILQSARSQMTLKSAHRSGGMAMFIEMKTPSIEEIDSADSDLHDKTDVSTKRFTSGVKGMASAFGGREARSWEAKTPSIEEIDSVDSDLHDKTDVSTKRFTSGVKRRASAFGGREGRSWEAKTPSIEEIYSVDSDLHDKTDVGRFTPGVKGLSSGSWNIQTPSIEEIGSVGDDDVDAPSARARGGGRWSSRTPSIEEMETRDGQTRGEDDQNETKHKSYWIDL